MVKVLDLERELRSANSECELESNLSNQIAKPPLWLILPTNLTGSITRSPPQLSSSTSTQSSRRAMRFSHTSKPKRSNAIFPSSAPQLAGFFTNLRSSPAQKTIFELGSAVGYSTIWWARAVGEGGRVIYTDGDRKKADEARGYFERAGVADRITVQVGDALELLSEQKQQFDIIFCDIDKEDYPRAFRLALPRLRKGGLLVADNVLWSGRVAEKNPSEASTKAILEFNRLLYSSPDLFTTILPIRDGVAVALKK